MKMVFFVTELSPEDFGWREYQNFYSAIPSMIRRQLAKRTYELPSEMTGFGSGSSGGKYIKIGLPGKLILGEYFEDNMRISFPGKPI